MIRGFNNKKEVDYFVTYFPMTKIAIIRTLLPLTVIHGLVVHQMDVETTFLNGDLEEEIYMSQPESCIIPSQEKKVYKLRKPRYGFNKLRSKGIKNLIAR